MLGMCTDGQQSVPIHRHSPHSQQVPEMLGLLPCRCRQARCGSQTAAALAPPDEEQRKMNRGRLVNADLLINVVLEAMAANECRPVTQSSGQQGKASERQSLCMTCLVIVASVALRALALLLLLLLLRLDNVVGEVCHGE